MKSIPSPHPSHRSSRLPALAVRWLLSLAALACPPAILHAGGGPERVLLVVNPESPDSMTIANHYANLRSIPPDNIAYLPWPTKATTSDIDTFRERILLPLLANMRKRNLSEQIDYIVYSSDFPWAIALNSDVRQFLNEARKVESQLQQQPGGNPPDAKNPQQLQWPQQYTPVGSINGLTYLWQAVAIKTAAYFEPRSNFYMRPFTPPNDEIITQAFRSTRQYDPDGKTMPRRGRSYYLSTILGVTAGRGNSLDEVIAYLQRSALADATRPDGTIYFVQNNDIRSKVRDELFSPAAEALNKLNVKAEIIGGTVPLNKPDVQGLEMGTASFDWKASGSTIRPGALCDNFTSFGGVMRENSPQTPLSEFLRFGAAGAGGAVTEPFAIAEKFPSPLVQVHYARGCTLAEAFYQSIHSPYQLLIVGDPLCRPWAVPPEVSVSGVTSRQTIRGAVTLHPAAKLPDNQQVQSFSLYVDSHLAAECKPNGTLKLDTTPFGDGYHELRVVAVGPEPIESQGRFALPVQFDNRNRKITASLVDQGPIKWDATARIAAHSPGSVGIVAIQGSRIVANMPGDRGQLEIPAKNLGAGPVLLRIMGLGDGGVETTVTAQPLEFTVELRIEEPAKTAN